MNLNENELRVFTLCYVKVSQGQEVEEVVTCLGLRLDQPNDSLRL